MFVLISITVRQQQFQKNSQFALKYESYGLKNQYSSLTTIKNSKNQNLNIIQTQTWGELKNHPVYYIIFIYYTMLYAYYNIIIYYANGVCVPFGPGSGKVVLFKNIFFTCVQIDFNVQLRHLRLL